LASASVTPLSVELSLKLTGPALIRDGANPGWR
jgi:hypothetical protein